MTAEIRDRPLAMCLNDQCQNLTRRNLCDECAARLKRDIDRDKAAKRLHGEGQRERRRREAAETEDA